MYLQHIPPILLALAASVSCAPATQPLPDVTGQFQGHGKIIAVADTFVDTAIAENTKIGCLDSNGSLTIDDCATFRVEDKYPYLLFSPAGECTFYNMRMPKNTDSYYGADTYAWFCGDVDDADREDAAARLDPWAPRESFYTVRGFYHPYLCTGDFGCYFDVKKAPTKEENAIPVWQYYWGSQQMGITPGHTKIVWLWEPVSGTEEQ